MGLFSRLFGGGGSDNPTKDWPPPSGPRPQVSLIRQALESFGGTLPFGSPLESARIFGRPDAFHAGKGYASMTYSAWALTLEFEEGRFVQVTHDLGDIPGEPPANPFTAGEVKGPDGLSLSARTTKADLLRRFGEPGKTQSLEDETILYYKVGPLVSEFQLNDDDLLFAWDVYLD